MGRRPKARQSGASSTGDRKAINLGIGGDQTQHVLWRLDNEDYSNIKPKLAVLMIGTNNSKSNTGEEIGQGITDIVAKMRAKMPTAKVLVLAVFPPRREAQ